MKTYAREAPRESIIAKLEILCGVATTDFIVGINSSSMEQKAKAEALKAKLSNPEMQQRIHNLYEETQRLQKDLKGWRMDEL